MIIGLDFDNTIVDYDFAFYQSALDVGLITADVEKTKTAVKDYLINLDREDKWTELQGLVYGAKMEYAAINEGFEDCMKYFKSIDAHVFIVSHKTRYPYAGEKYDLHKAALDWMQKHLLDKSLIEKNNINLCLTKEDKLAKIEELGCGYFVDDLVSILEHPAFPKNTVKLLYGNEKPNNSDIKICKSWGDVAKFITPQR